MQTLGKSLRIAANSSGFAAAHMAAARSSAELIASCDLDSHPLNLSLSPFGNLARPADLKDTAKKAWVRYIEPAHWLDASREPLAIAFCRLWQEFTDDPPGFSAARHGQLRLYSQELGLSDERARVDVTDVQEDDPFAKFDA